jgi:hypothetical protein
MFPGPVLHWNLEKARASATAPKIAMREHERSNIGTLRRTLRRLSGASGPPDVICHTQTPAPLGVPRSQCHRRWPFQEPMSQHQSLQEPMPQQPSALLTRPLTTSLSRAHDHRENRIRTARCLALSRGDDGNPGAPCSPPHGSRAQEWR